jgi:protein-disulfide isomerase
MLMTRRAFTTALSLTGLAALAGFSPLRLFASATAQGATDVAKQGASDVAKPVSLPDMALGAINAPVTIVEYAAATCPHCGRFGREVFPKIKAEYIDTGKVRYVFREFPLNIKDVACSMLARRIASDDFGKYFAVVDIQFRQQDALVDKTTETLKRIGRQAGLSEKAVEDCLKDQVLMSKIEADVKYASEVLKVEGTPTFFINGEMVAGEMSFDEIDAKIKPLLKT